MRSDWNFMLLRSQFLPRFTVVPCAAFMLKAYSFVVARPGLLYPEPQIQHPVHDGWPVYYRPPLAKLQDPAGGRVERIHGAGWEPALHHPVRRDRPHIDGAGG